MAHEEFAPGSRAEPWRDLAAVCEASPRYGAGFSTVLCYYGTRQVTARLSANETPLVGAFAREAMALIAG